MNAAFMPYEQAGRGRGRAGSRSREPAGTHQHQKPRNHETPVSGIALEQPESGIHAAYLVRVVPE